MTTFIEPTRLLHDWSLTHSKQIKRLNNMKSESWTFNGESVLDSQGNNACTKVNGPLIASAPWMRSALESIVKVLDGSQPKDIPGALMVAQFALKVASGEVVCPELKQSYNEAWTKAMLELSHP